MAFSFSPTILPEVLLVESFAFDDQRGYFMEIYKKTDFQKAGLPTEFHQDNFSFSQKNVLRGLHYQLPPHAQAKLVGVLEGAIWDVAVDIRKSSPTFRQWVGVELSDKNLRSLYIPAGFAHGFVVLSSTAKVLYKATAEYDKNSERGIVWNDPILNISWPVQDVILSEKDKMLPDFKDADYFT